MWQYGIIIIDIGITTNMKAEGNCRDKYVNWFSIWSCLKGKDKYKSIGSSCRSVLRQRKIKSTNVGCSVDVIFD